MTDSTTNETADDITGFELQPIEQQIIAGDGSTVVNICYNRIEYTWTFDTKGGHWENTADEIITVSGLYGNYVDWGYTPIRDCYEFEGWCLDEDCTVYYESDWIFSQNMTLYAKWRYIYTDITVVTPIYQDIEGLLTYDPNYNSLTASQTYTYHDDYYDVNRTGSYKSYRWYFDGELQTNTNNTFTPNTKSLTAGVHSVSVFVTTHQGESYSAEMTFNVQKEID